MPEHTPAPTASRAVYGFAMYLSFKLFFVLYLLWAVIPEEWFRLAGITCLPQRHWAVTIPIFLLTVLALFAFVIYPSLSAVMTPNVDDITTIKDSSGYKRKQNGLKLVELSKMNECCCADTSKCFKELYDKECEAFAAKAIPILQDLNIWDVSENLYLK